MPKFTTGSNIWAITLFPDWKYHTHPFLRKVLINIDKLNKIIYN